MLVKKDRKVIAKTRFIELSHLAVFGNIQITTQAVRDLCHRTIPICYFSTGGWFQGITHGMGHKNVELRIRQFSAAESPAALTIARSFVEGKIRNCRTLLRRNSSEQPQSALRRLGELAKDASCAKSPDELLGLEGSAGRIYFLHFGSLLKNPGGLPVFDFKTRNRRPPCDPVNAMLSYMYALLAKDLTVTLLAVGFDPFLGFYHKPRYGRPSLALDMMEEFRPLIADSTVLRLVNNGEVRAQDFLVRGGAVAMTADSKRAVLRAYERRMNELVTHPLFGYTVSYRRILEVQARLLARHLLNEIDRYPAFCTR